MRAIWLGDDGFMDVTLLSDEQQTNGREAVRVPPGTPGGSDE
jgi:hypothetical protein